MKENKETSGPNQEQNVTVDVEVFGIHLHTTVEYHYTFLVKGSWSETSGTFHALKAALAERKAHYVIRENEFYFGIVTINGNRHTKENLEAMLPQGIEMSSYKDNFSNL